MPDAAWAVSVHPPSSSRRKGHPPVLTSSNPLSTLLQRFACARLSQPCLSGSPPLLLTTAACGGLRSAPDCRPRRTFLHLSYSYATPFGPAILVTQEPLRSLRLRRSTGILALPNVKTAYSRRGNVPFNKQPSHREGYCASR